jgi:lysozyme
MSVPNDALTTSDTGIALIKRFEGFCARAYHCPAGIATIGYGHVIKPGENLTTVTEIQATALLHLDVRIAEAAVKRLIHMPLSRSQFDALVSFTFNLGGGALEKSTLRKLIHRGDFAAVPAELNRWVFAKGQKLPGLVARRAAEGALFANRSDCAPGTSQSASS